MGIMRRFWTTVFGWVAGYNATDPTRKVIYGAKRLSKASANQLLSGNLEQLRAYCRNLERNNPTARAGIEALTALVVGSGIALEPDTGNPEVDKLLRDRFAAFCEDAGVNGESIWYLQAVGVREMVTAGEGLWRIVPDQDPTRPVPIRILPLDAEYISDLPAGEPGDATAVNGIELDQMGRPIAYHLSNPENPRSVEVVPAGAIVHFFERRRPVQNRGEPWLAPLIETLQNERDLVDAELKAAATTASIGIAIESEMPPGESEESTDGDPVHDLALGSVVRMFPGEKVHPFSHTRPSQQIAPFRQMLRGDIAAALRIPSRFLDRDVSRANYSSMRADMIDNERLLGPVREWLGKQTIGRVYSIALPYMAASLGIKMPRGNYRLIPDGQPYVDPVKDAQAAMDAIGGNLSTYEHEVGKRGGDYRQVMEQRRKEQLELAMANIEQIKAMQAACDASGVPGLTWAHISTIGGAASAPGAYLAASVSAPAAEVVAGDKPADPVGTE